MCAVFLHFLSLYIIVCMLALGKFDCLNFNSLATSPKVYPQVRVPTFILRVSKKTSFVFLLIFLL
jgi:hypothetical protein